MKWTFFVQFHFTEHEVLLGEGEKWGKTKQKVLHIYERGGTQGSTSENTAFSFLSFKSFFHSEPLAPFWVIVKLCNLSCNCGAGTFHLSTLRFVFFFYFLPRQPLTSTFHPASQRSDLIPCKVFILLRLSSNVKYNTEVDGFLIIGFCCDKHI